MIRFTSYGSLVLAMALTLGAAGPAAAAPPSKGSEKHQDPRACQLVTASDVAATLKLTVGQGQPGNGRGTFTCNFSLSDGSGRAVVVELRTGAGARASFLQKRSDGPTVYGVGDEAVWLTNYSTLLVLTRDNDVLAIDLTTAASAVKRGTPKDGAADLAKKALSRL